MNLKAPLMALLCVCLLQVIASADITVEDAQFHNSVVKDMRPGSENLQFLVSGLTTVYDNIPSGAVAGNSVTDMGATWGDAVTPIDTGYLDGLTLSIFNSATGNTLPILTTDLNISMFDAATFNPTGTNTPILSFFGNVNFGAGGLAPGFFSLVTFSNLSPLFPGGPNINGPIVITQRLSNVTGGSVRAGIVHYTADTIGSQYVTAPWSATAHYRSNTVNGTGLFNSSTNRIAMKITAVPEPSSFVVLGLLGLGVAFVVVRRKRS